MSDVAAHTNLHTMTSAIIGSTVSVVVRERSKRQNGKKTMAERAESSTDIGTGMGSQILEEKRTRKGICRKVWIFMFN
jgi:hypothetical protein